MEYCRVEIMMMIKYIIVNGFVCVCIIALVCGCTPEKSSVDSSKAERSTKVEKMLLTHLDKDGNGLYDDVERKALLDAIKAECPGVATNFDADGDGKVSIQEQTEGRHPLSMTLPKIILESNRKIPWAVDIFPEWISSAYLQEDVAVGRISRHQTRGNITADAVQDDAELQPVKKSEKRGVEFVENSGQFFSMPGQRDARWNYRWCILTFRIDAASGKDDTTVLLDLNKGRESNKSSPKIWYKKDQGLNVRYQGRNKWGLDRRTMTSEDVVADGKTWNVLVCGIRYGRLFASVNGRVLATEKAQPDRFSGDWLHGTTSYLGDERKGNMCWAYDALVFGLTEPSEAMVRKMTGWAAHRLGFQQNLPEDHPYRQKRPVLDDEDFPYRYVHDDEKWTQWGESLKKSVTRVNAGGERVVQDGFERVFYDDFRNDRVKASTSGEGDLWTGPGFNPAVGVDASLMTPGRKPDTYPYDADNRLQMLSLVKQGKRWRGSAFYSVNDLGHGYTWSGPKIFRIRCKLPALPQKEIGGGLFPAFWSYNPDFIFWRTANRMEVDWFEFDGKNGYWYNGLSTHLHYSHLKNNIFAKNPKSYKRYKVYSGELTEKKGKIPGGLFFWDGVFHTWEFVVDNKMTYVNVTLKDAQGADRWVEVCRCYTCPTYLARLDLQLDYALKGKSGMPKSDERQDFIVDWIEVLQKSSVLEEVPEPFTAKPALSGDAKVGGTVKCSASLKGITDIRYYWFADGYPLTYGANDTIAITESDAGTKIRCMVKAVGARDMPEAWSSVLVVQ